MFYFSLWRDSPSWLLTMATGVSFQKCHATLSSCRLTHSCLTSSLCPLWQPFQAYAVYFWCQAGPGRLKGNLNPLNNEHHTPLGDKRWFEKIFAYMCISNLLYDEAPAWMHACVCVQRGRNCRSITFHEKTNNSFRIPGSRLQSSDPVVHTGYETWAKKAPGYSPQREMTAKLDPSLRNTLAVSLHSAARCSSRGTHRSNRDKT